MISLQVLTWVAWGIALPTRPNRFTLGLISSAFLIWNWYFAPRPLRVSEETTLITSPLAKDGLPDYRLYLLEREKRGVTPENNAARLFWKAMGPAEIPKEYRKAFFAEIETNIPDGKQVLTQPNWQRAVRFWGYGSLASAKRKAIEQRLRSLVHQRCLGSPLLKTIETWAERNRAPLNTLTRASELTHFYSPPPNWVVDPDTSVMAGFLSDEAIVKDAVASLVTRAMVALSRGDLKTGRIDLCTAERLTNFYTQPDILVTALIAAKQREIVDKGWLVFIDAITKSTEARICCTLLGSRRDLSVISVAIRHGEAAMLLDGLTDTYERGPSPLGRLAWIFPADTNVLFTYLTSWLNRYASVAGMTHDRKQRLAEANKLEEDLKRLDLEIESQHKHYRQILFSTEARSLALAKIYVSHMMPAMTDALIAEDRSCARQRLTLLAAALKLHRLEHGAYPDSLAQLTPNPLNELPFDPFTNEPFRYERRGDGFLIYSLGPNGVDDGGSDMDGEFVDGEFAPIDWFGERAKPQGPDDVVVRLPIPVLELPTAP